MKTGYLSLFLSMFSLTASAAIVGLTDTDYVGSSLAGSFSVETADDSLLVAVVITRSTGAGLGVTIDAAAMTLLDGGTAFVDTVGGRGSVYFYGLQLGSLTTDQSLSYSVSLSGGEARTLFYQVENASQDLTSIEFGGDAGDASDSESSLTLDTGVFANTDAGSFLIAGSIHGKNDTINRMQFLGSHLSANSDNVAGSDMDVYLSDDFDSALGWASTSGVSGDVSVTGFYSLDADSDNRGTAIGGITIAAVPEPSTVGLLGLAALLGLGILRRRRS